MIVYQRNEWLHINPPEGSRVRSQREVDRGADLGGGRLQRPARLERRDGEKVGDAEGERDRAGPARGGAGQLWAQPLVSHWRCRNPPGGWSKFFWRGVPWGDGSGVCGVEKEGWRSHEIATSFFFASEPSSLRARGAAVRRGTDGTSVQTHLSAQRHADEQPAPRRARSVSAWLDTAARFGRSSLTPPRGPWPTGSPPRP